MISVSSIPACNRLSPLELENSSPRFSPGYLQHTAQECACGDWPVPVRPPHGHFLCLSVSIRLPAPRYHNNNRPTISANSSDEQNSLTQTAPRSAFKHSWHTTCSAMNNSWICEITWCQIWGDPKTLTCDYRGNIKKCLLVLHNTTTTNAKRGVARSRQ